MSVGFPLTKNDIDTKTALEIGAVWSSMAAVHQRLLWLNDSSHNTAALQPLGYAGSDDTTLRAAFTDLDKLWQISHAAATQPAVNDFFFNAKLLGGVNWYG